MSDPVSVSMDGQSERWDELYRGKGRQWRGVTDLGDLPFQPGSRILEVGCGNGKTAEALCRSGYEVTAVDFSSEAVAACRTQLGDRAEVVEGSLLALPFPDGSFDGAVLFHVMEHILPEDLPRASSELSRVLVPGSFAVARSFSAGDLRSAKGERISEDTVVRGNGIRYRYYTEETFGGMFPDAETVGVRTVREPTRFGAERVRVEAVFRF